MANFMSGVPFEQTNNGNEKKGLFDEALNHLKEILVPQPESKEPQEADSPYRVSAKHMRTAREKAEGIHAKKKREQEAVDRDLNSLKADKAKLTEIVTDLVEIKNSQAESLDESKSVLGDIQDLLNKIEGLE